MIASFPPVAAQSEPSRAPVVHAAPQKSIRDMRRDDMRLTWALVWTRGQWEIWLFGDELITWRPFAEPRDAVAWADRFQQDLERNGSR